MTKQQTVELLQKQLPGFYSVEQVINIVNGIEEGSSDFDKEKMDELKDAIDTKVRLYLGRLNGDDIADYDSAELELNGNEISVYNIDVNTDSIIDEVNDAVEAAFNLVFKQQETQTT